MREALAGNGAAAPRAFSQYTAEVERRQVPRFAGRAVNFAGWVLRNLGAEQQALDLHLEALDARPAPRARAEVTVAALEDLAELAWRPGTPTARRCCSPRPRSCSCGDVVFGWRLAFKHQLLTARRPSWPATPSEPGRWPASWQLQRPRSACRAMPASPRLTVHLAGRMLDLPADPAAIEADLDLLDRSAAIEAWRWTGEIGAAFGHPGWLARAEERARRLAGQRRRARRRAGRAVRRAACGLAAGRRASREAPAGLARQVHQHRDDQGLRSRRVRLQRCGAARPAGLRSAPATNGATWARPSRQRGQLQPAPTAPFHRVRPSTHTCGSRPARASRLKPRIAEPRLSVLLEGQVPGRRAVAEPGEHGIDRAFGRVRPARRERAGGDGPRPTRRDSARAASRRAGVGQAERSHDQAEAVVAEGQSGRVGRHRPQRRPALAQRAGREIGRDHLGRAGRQRRPARRSGASPEVEHPRAPKERRDVAGQRGGQRRVNRLGSGSPRSAARRRRQPGPTAGQLSSGRGARSPGFPTRQAPRHIRPAPSPSRTARARRAG